MVRIVGQPVLHRQGIPSTDPNIWLTPCGVRYIPADWPRSIPRSSLPRCKETLCRS